MNLKIKNSKMKNGGSKHGFSLVELLVVIAIMGILMAMIIGGAAVWKRKAIISRAQTELGLIQTSIDNYHSRLGFYPPDNPRDAATPPLFYELLGTYTTNAPAPAFSTLGVTEVITTNAVGTYFGRNGFMNSADHPNEVQNFFPGMKASHFHEISSNPDVELLCLDVEGPEYRNPVSNTVIPKVNPWRYTTGKRAVRNPGKYDLWVEVIIGGKTNIIGNWKE